MSEGGLICERCGSFTQSRELLGGKQLCPACATRVVQDGAFYSHLYVLLVGLLLNPTTMLVLLSLNHRRLGDQQRARSLLIGAVVVGVLYTAYMLAPVDLPNSVGFGVSVALTITMTRQYRELWKRLEALGARRANRVWPVAITVAVVVLLAGASIAKDLATGQGD